MITRIEVDGFKSLTGFALNFARGLNILVGPNGSGKTNIVSFFEFLTHLMETDASEATSRVGGAGAVFRRVGEDYEKRIVVHVVGCVQALEGPVRARSKQSKLPYYLYDYSFSLLFPDTRDSVLFEKQRLRLKRSRRFLLREAISPSEKWAVDIEANLHKDGVPAAKINTYDSTLLDLPFYQVKRPAKADRDLNAETLISGMLASNVSLVPVVSRYTPELWGMADDIRGGQIYNIIPSRVKMPEDSAKPPGIARDGSGLAATLYALQRNRYPKELRPGYHFRRTTERKRGPLAIDQLKGLLRLVNTSIEDIQVINDPLDNQLRVRFTVKSGTYDAVVPMSLMSDGTLKWVALVTAALTAGAVFSIEEPENYLHPQMQGQIVNILREILFREQSDRFTLMTTHSETLLNNCRPDELIIVSMCDGKTIAKRCTNADAVSEEIRRTGFGLGYYYVNNSLENA